MRVHWSPTVKRLNETEEQIQELFDINQKLSSQVSKILASANNLDLQASIRSGKDLSAGLRSENSNRPMSYKS